MFGQAQSAQPTTNTSNLFGSSSAPTPTTGFATNILGSGGQQQQASKPFFTQSSSGTNIFGTPTIAGASTAAAKNQPFSFGFGLGQQKQQQQPSLNTTTTMSTTQQQQQQQQQQQPLLSLQSVFPDTNVPHFIVTPDKVTRTSMPKLLSTANTKTRDLAEEYPTATPLSFGAKRTILPRFLTAATIPSPNRHASGKKRGFESGNESRSEHQRVYKRSHSNGNDSVFGTPAAGSFCNSNTGTVVSDSDDPPAVSIWNVGINTHRYTANEQHIVQKCTPTDLWSDSVRYSLSTVAQTKTSTTAVETRPKEACSSWSSGNTIIRVFGFPPDQKPAVVEYFSRYGAIEERYQSPSNWMTLRYATSQMAESALEGHGKMIGKEIRVGVDRAKSMTG